MKGRRKTKLEKVAQLVSELEAVEVLCPCYRCEAISLAIAELKTAVYRPRELASCGSEVRR